MHLSRQVLCGGSIRQVPHTLPCLMVRPGLQVWLITAQATQRFSAWVELAWLRCMQSEHWQL